jgi:hypothetical protein
MRQVDGHSHFEPKIYQHATSGKSSRFDAHLEIVANILWRNVMKVTSKSGAAIAAAAATLFLAGATMSTSTYAADEGHCVGANACKGQSACKGGNHACKGQNACKGQGFSAMTKDKCVAAKGKFEPA